MDRFIYALGIRGVGAKTAKTLAQTFHSLENIAKAKEADFVDIEDIGDIVAKNIGEYFLNPKNGRLIENLLARGVNPQGIRSDTAGPLSGKKVLFTGTLTLARRLAKEQAQKAGAEIVSSISKRTDILIVGEKPGSKLQKAQALGVKVIDEAEFRKMTGQLKKILGLKLNNATQGVFSGDFS